MSHRSVCHQIWDRCPKWTMNRVVGKDRSRNLRSDPWTCASCQLAAIETTMSGAFGGASISPRAFGSQNTPSSEEERCDASRCSWATAGAALGVTTALCVASSSHRVLQTRRARLWWERDGARGSLLARRGDPTNAYAAAQAVCTPDEGRSLERPRRAWRCANLSGASKRGRVGSSG